MFSVYNRQNLIKGIQIIFSFKSSNIFWMSNFYFIFKDYFQIEKYELSNIIILMYFLR